MHVEGNCCKEVNVMVQCSEDVTRHYLFNMQQRPSTIHQLYKTCVAIRNMSIKRKTMQPQKTNKKSNLGKLDF